MEGRAASRWREQKRLGRGDEVEADAGLEKKKEKVRLFENLIIFS